MFCRLDPVPVLAVALTVAVGPPSAIRTSADELPPSEVIVLYRCPVDYEDAALLGSGLPGVLQEVGVRMGDRVEAGQVIGRLRDGDARAELELKRALAASDVEIRTQEARYAQALSRFRSAEPLKDRSYVSHEQFSILRLEVETAALELEAARHRRRLAEIQARQAEEVVRQREFVSPIDGVVVEVLKRPGEPVGLNDPVFRVVDPDHLRVTGHLDVGDAWRVKPGQRVRFMPEIGGADLPVEQRTFAGRVVFVDTAIDPASQTCRVVVAVDNTVQLLRAGLEGRLEIEPGSVAVEASPPPNPAEQPPIRQPHIDPSLAPPMAARAGRDPGE